MTSLLAPQKPAILQTLQQGLSTCLEQPIQITSIRANALYSYSTHPIYRLQVILNDSQTISVIFKRLRQDARQGREILLYQRLLRNRRFGAPACYAELCDPNHRRYWLFMEDVGELKLEYCAIDEWLRAFRWLARMHTTYYDQALDLRALNCLGEHDTAFYQDLAQAAFTQIQQKAESTVVNRFMRLLDRLDYLVAELIQQPQTLVHGDLSCHNLIVQPDYSIRPIDWEWAAIGVPAWDVAKLLSGWGKAKPRLFAAYWDELSQQRPVDRQTFDRALTSCEMMQILWYIRFWIKPCQDAAFVYQLLDRMEMLRNRLD